MAASDKVLKRAYSISLPGAAQSITQIKNLEAAFESLRKKKSDLNAVLAGASTGKEAASTDALRAKIAALEKEMEKLTKQRGAAGAEALNQARAEQALANARAADARAAAQQARADQSRTTSVIQQDRELERLIAAEERQRLGMQRNQQTVVAAVGSYNALQREYRELYAIVRAAPTGTGIDFRGQQLGYNEAIANLQRLSAAEQDFRRQFSKDGLLVGEYTTGIVNAFRNAGLDNLITGQLTRAEAEVARLNQEFERTRQELSQVGVTGAGNLERLERSLIENRQQVAQLETQLEGARRAYRGVGDVGQQVTDGLRRGFASLRQNISQLVLGYVGFQAILTATQSIFRDTVALDSQAAALAVVSVNSKELAINQAFLAEVTDRLGLQILPTTSAYKGFYAASTQAGIGADETRRIFESATAASSRLKLSQENTNGVLLAFGQIASKGKVQAEELRGQIGERIPGAFAIAARSIGVTQQQLNKMLEQGQVIASDFLPKFATELQKTFGGDSTEKVEGLQASINRLKNQFTNIVAEKGEGLTSLITGLIQGGSILLSIIALITGNLPAVITLLALYATGWAVSNKELVIQKAQLLLSNAQLLITQIRLGAVTLLTGVYSAALGLFTGATTLATGAVRLFNSAVLSNPLGIILTLLTVVVAGTVAFAGALNGTTGALKAQSLEMQANAEATRKATEATAKETSELIVNVRIASDLANSHKTRKQAMENLIAKYPEMSRALRGEEIDVRALADAYQEVATKIRIASRSKAAAALTEEKLKDVTGVEGLLQRIETEAAIQNPGKKGNRNIVIEGLSEAEKKMFVGGFFGNDLTKNSSASSESRTAVSFLAEDLNKIRTFLGKTATEKTKVYTAYATASEKADKILQDSQVKVLAGPETVGQALDRLDAAMKQKRDDARKILRADTAELDKNREEQKAIQKQIDDLNGKEGPKSKSYGGSRLTGGQKDAQKDAEADKDAAIRAENKKFEELKKVRALEQADEVQYQRNLLKIETDSIDKKLSSLKEKNATERKLAEELRDKKAELAGKTAQTIYEIEEGYAGRAFDQARKNAEDQLAVIRDSDTDALTQAEAQVNYLKQLEEATKTYFAAITTAAGNNKNAIALIEAQKAAALKDITRDSNRDLRLLQKARFDYEIAQLEKVRTLQDQILRTQTAQRRLAILQDPNQTNSKKERSLNRLGDEAEVANLSNQIDINNREIEAFRKKYKQFAFFSNEYRDLATRNAELIAERQQKLNENEFRYATGAFKAKEESLFSYLEKKLNLDQEETQALQQGAQIAGQMLQNYFAGEQERIDQKRTATLERIDLEKQELLSSAQSNNERAAIEKQYDAKKKQAEKDAAKERQQLALRQLEVETALGIARTLASMPFPANVFLAAAEGLLFLQQRQKIKSQKFEYGGMPTGGGDISGKRHSAGGTPFTFAGRDYEAEAGELAIINRNAAASNQRMTVSGTPRQIASAINSTGGGISFAPGAAVRKYEYGGVLRAPNFTPSGYGSSTAAGGDFTPLLEVMAAQANAIAATADQVRQLEVVLVTSTVTDAQKKEARSQSVSTI